MKSLELLKTVKDFCIDYDFNIKIDFDEAIAELETMQDIILEKEESLDIERFMFKNKLEELNNRSCESCKYYKKTIHQDYKTCFLIKNNGYNLDCGDDFCCNRYEAKS